MSYHKLYRNTAGSLLLRLGLVYFSYSLCRLAFYSINSHRFGKLSWDDWKGIIQGGLLFDTSAIAYTNILFIILWLVPIRPLLNNRLYRTSIDIGFISINSLCIILNVVDFYYYEFNLKRLTADFSHWIGETNATLILGNFLISHWLMVIGVLVAIWSFIWLYRKIPFYNNLSLSSGSFVLYQLAMMIVFIGLGIAGMRGGFLHSTRPITLSNAGKYVTNPSWMPIVLNTPFSIIRTIEIKAYPETKFMNDSIALVQYNPVHRYHFSTDTQSISDSKKNVIIIILESFSREHSGYLNPDLEGGNYKGYMPFLDSLMQISTVCTNAFANGRKSIDAMPSILAGLPSLIEPYVLSHNSLNKINSVASLLKPNGYHSAFFHGAPNGSMGFQAFARIAGFDQYYGKSEYNNDNDYDGIWGIWDEEFFQFFAKTLTSFKPPFLGVCFSVSSHHPFILPEKYRGHFDKGKLEVHQCVGYTDYAIRKFFDYAKTQSWYTNTLFVISADHSTIAWSAKYNSPVGAFAIPIIYFDPTHPQLNRFEQVTQQTDIMPSILDYLHYDQPFVAFGNSIFDTHANRFALNYLNEQYQTIDSSFNMSSFDGKKQTEFYNINSSWMPVSDPSLLESPLKSKALLFQQALIQQYNQRILHDQLTVTH